MKIKGQVKLGLMTLLSVLLMIGAFAVSAEAGRVTLQYLTTSTRSGAYALNVAEAKAVQDVYPDIEVTVVETGGGFENIELLRAGGGNWAGNILHTAAISAYTGTYRFKGRALPEMRALYTPVTFPITFFVTKDSGVKSVYDLTGKRFGVRSGSADSAIIKNVLAINGIEPKWMQAKVGALTDATKARSIIGYAKAGCPEPNMLDIASMRPITILAIPKEMSDKANKDRPGWFVQVPIPPGTYPGQDEEVPSVGASTAECVLKDFPDDLAYKITRALYLKGDDIAPTFGGVSKWFALKYKPAERSLKLTNIPFHPGAIKFYKEMGLTVPDNLIPPEMK